MPLLRTEIQPRPVPRPRSWSAVGVRLYAEVCAFLVDEGCTVRRIDRLAWGIVVERDGASFRVEVIHPDDTPARVPGRVQLRSIAELRDAAASAGLALGAAL